MRQEGDAAVALTRRTDIAAERVGRGHVGGRAMHGNSKERGIMGGAASASGAQSSGRPSTPPDDPGRQDKPDGDMSSNGGMGDRQAGRRLATQAGK